MKIQFFFFFFFLGGGGVGVGGRVWGIMVDAKIGVNFFVKIQKQNLGGGGSGLGGGGGSG